MRTLAVFNQVSLDGFIADAQGDMSWAHKHDAEWDAWIASNASGGGELLFGRVTYQQMASWWPSPLAQETMPAIAERMNNGPKIVFSRSMARAEWHNTRLLAGDLASEVKKLKSEAGPPMVLMGSASIVSQLARFDLIDSLQLVINPLVLGAGKAMFAGVTERLSLRLTGTRAFQNGNVALTYERAR